MSNQRLPGPPKDGPTTSPEVKCKTRLLGTMPCGCEVYEAKTSEGKIAAWASHCRKHDAAPSLLAALKATLQALESHLDADTLHANLKHRDQLCPCNENEVKMARAAIESAGG